MFIVTRIWISISDLDLNSIIESHNENLKNLLNFIIIIKMANGMGSFAFFGFISRQKGNRNGSHSKNIGRGGYVESRERSICCSAD